MIQNVETYTKDISNSIETYIQNNDLITRWLSSLDVLEDTKETYKENLEFFIEWLKANNIDSVSKVVINNYKKYLIERYSNSTVCLKISSLKSFYSFLEEEQIASNITKNLKGAKISKGFKRDVFTFEQIKTILNGIDTSTLLGMRDFAMINLLLSTALRSCEIYRANIEDIRNKDGQTVLYIQGKGRTEKDEFVVLTLRIIKILNDYFNMREEKQHIIDNAPLFISVSDRNFGERLTLFSIRWVFKNRLRDVGIDSKRLTTHSTRHSAITFSLLLGANLQDVKAMARHENLNTTLLYAHNVNRIENAPEKKLDTIFEKMCV